VRLDPSRSHEQYPDLKPQDARLLGRVQRPVTDATRTEAQTADEPAWRTFPTWHVFGDADRAIPVEPFRFQVSRSAPRGRRCRK
jgi:hypothetical protein